MEIENIRFDHGHWIMPGMTSAHSHAFQRALRGRTQRRATDARTFWSWRGLMYRLAETLDPEDVYHIARFAYTELAMSGVTTVGEFHYLHHDKNGQPYENRAEMAEAVIRAAKDAGVRICLIRIAYTRGGFGQELTPAQMRFSDPSVDLVLQDIASLQKKFADDPLVRIALGAHSVRAVPIDQIQELSAYAEKYRLPFHIHVCEQRREIEESLKEYGSTPVALLNDHGVLSPRFVGVHATHLSPSEIQALGQAQAFVCICRTTERDLGDGLPPISDLIRAGAKLCVGVDGHACENAFEEIRAVEFDERSRLEARYAVAEACELLDAATHLGLGACGFDPINVGDEVWLSASDPSIAGADETTVADHIVFAATPRAVRRVSVAGNTIVEDGVHVAYESALPNYIITLKKLMS